MPIYEYECLTCGTTFEKRQSFSEVAKADCPNGHSETRRLISSPAIVFKGSGFYVNDSRSKQNLATTGKTKDDTKDAKDTKAAPSESSPASTPAASSTESAPAKSAEPSAAS